jgi:hypothetical protein
MRIRTGRKVYRETTHHERTLASEIQVRMMTVLLCGQPNVIKQTVCWFRSAADAFTIQWNTAEKVEGKRRSS